MAENEYLDSTKARRWFAVAEGIRDGCDFDELTMRVQDRFYKTLRIICKDLPVVEMLSAVDDPQKLVRLCEHIEGGSDVKDLLLAAAFRYSGPINVVEQFLGDALQLFRRYRSEWQGLLEVARRNGCDWASHIDLPVQAA